MISSISQQAWKHFLESQRWYGAKGRRIARVEVRYESPLEPGGSGAGPAWTLLEARFEDGASHLYQLPALAVAASGELRESLESRPFLRWLSEGFRGTQPVSGGFLFQKLAEFSAERLVEHPAHLVEGEMSNTLLRAGDGLMAKIYRHVQAGEHPELEAMALLERSGFEHMPRLYGTVSGELGQYSGALMLLMEDLSGSRNLWDLFTDASARPSSLDTLAGRLGEVTAAFHRAFYQAGAVYSPFRQPSFSAADLAPLERLAALASRLEGRARFFAEEVLSFRGEILDLLQSPPALDQPFIRVHGDYHLGQVLSIKNKKRLAILDWEGEPARDLASRRLYWPAAWDLASMLRSFSYARFFSDREAGWERGLCQHFLARYMSYCRGAPFLPSTGRELGKLLEYFKLSKALAEVGYEIDHRPLDRWLGIPLAGILEMMPGA